MNRKLSLLDCFVAVALLCSSAGATPILSKDFDVDDTTNWTVNSSAGTDTFTNFYFDYSTVGIPSAPSSTGGSTRGLKMYANHTAAVFGGLSVSPTGFSLPSGNFKLKYDMWLNYNGSSTGNGIGAGGTTVPGGSGTTQAASVGILTAGSSAQWAGGVHDSLFFATTHDGGASQDYRVYPKAALAVPSSSGYYAAGTTDSPGSADSRNDSVAYYINAAFGDKEAPSAQLALYPQQFGKTRTGALGFAWRDVLVEKIGNIVTWKVDGVLIATVNSSTITGFGGNNFFLGHFDTNAGSSADPNDVNLLFTLIDNVSVVPEPSSMTLMGLSLIGLLVRGKRS
jgi:hypothetical protein